MTPTNWQAALQAGVGVPDAVLERLREIIREYYEHWGAWPTAAQIRAELLGP